MQKALSTVLLLGTILFTNAIFAEEGSPTTENKAQTDTKTEENSPKPVIEKRVEISKDGVVTTHYGNDTRKDVQNGSNKEPGTPHLRTVHEIEEAVSPKTAKEWSWEDVIQDPEIIQKPDGTYEGPCLHDKSMLCTFTPPEK